jgi:Na+/proline symporter
MASFMSAISIVSGAAEAYVYGTHFFTINVGNALGVALSLVLFIPTFYKLKTVSVFQVL